MDLMNKYNFWLENADEQTKAELLKIKDNEDEIYARFHTELEFGTAGMRGIIGAGTNRINRYVVAKATKGFADYINSAEPSAKKRGVAIGYDNRHKSREFAEVTAGVLAANGIKSYLFESLRTTPELSFAVRHLNCFGGVVITASHNPPEYNGYKLYDENGCQLIPSLAQKVMDNIAKVDNELAVEIMPLDKAGELIEIIGKDIDDIYHKTVLGIRFDTDTDKDITVIYTPQHGTGNIPVRQVLKTAGYNVIPVLEQCEPDPDFSNTKSPNPENTVAYEKAIELLKANNADIAIATDPDCDRLGAVINHKGEQILLTGNQSGAVILYYILSRHLENGTLPKNAVMFNTVVTSSLGDKIAEGFGVETEKTLTGFKFIGDKIKEHNAKKDKTFIFGYEESYGCLIGDFVRDKDAVQASLMFCEAADYYKKQGKTLIDVLEEIYNKFGYFVDTQKSVAFTDARGSEKIKKIMQSLREKTPDSIAGYPLKSVTDFLEPYKDFVKSDVLLYTFADGGFVSVRPSGTEPKCKFYFCIYGKDKKEAEEKLAKIKKEFDIYG